MDRNSINRVAMASASTLAMATAFMSSDEAKAKDEAAPARKTRRGQWGRRLVSYDREGPFHRQVGIKWVAGECLPLMQTYYKHIFMHATKGKRIYEGGTTMRLPQSPNAQGVSPSMTFYGNPAWAKRPRLTYREVPKDRMLLSQPAARKGYRASEAA